MVTGFGILRSTVRTVVDNFDDALAISGLPWVVLAALRILMLPDPDSVDPGLVTALVVAVATMAIGIWIAVAWHRFILLGERQRTLFPPWHGEESLAYFGRSFLLGVCVVGVVLVASLLIGILMPSFEGGMMALVPMLILLPALFLVYRLSPILPAAALGESMTLSQAMARTKPLAGAIFQAVVLVVVLIFGVQFVQVALGAGLVGIVFSLISEWVALLGGVALLSTIYSLTGQADEW